MKNSATYLLLFLYFISPSQAQQAQFNMAQGTTCLFNGSLYAYGLSSQKQQLSFQVYRLDLQLHVKDSFIVQLSKTNPDHYLRLSSDTLHQYLNIYLQEKDKKQVTVFRFTKKFEPVATIEHIDIARLNNTSMFAGEALYGNNYVYTIRIQSDTSGNQYYLNKYTLKSDAKNFDYEFKWQFPFEKKGIRSAHVFFADKKQVLMYVHVSSGIKTGQWLLKINAETGKLLRGIKLNAKGESSVYMLGNFIADSLTRSLQLLGEKFSEAQFNETENKLSITNRAFSSLYLMSIDSSGDVASRQDLKIPITTTVSGAKKANINCLLRIAEVQKDKSGTLSLETDLYSGTNNSLCYQYSNTLLFKLVPNEDKMILEKNIITPNPLIDKFYITNDKLDMNGRLCSDSLNQFEKIFYKPLVLPVKQDFKIDSDNNPGWVLSKSNIKKETITYALLQSVKKVPGLTVLDEILKTANPELIVLSPTSLVISKQTGNGIYELKLFPW